jgi:hypothetical protein
MPYKSEDERKAEEWVSLPEAVAHITQTEKCSISAARRQLISALVDASLGLLRWKREKDDNKKALWPFVDNHPPRCSRSRGRLEDGKNRLENR